VEPVSRMVIVLKARMLVGMCGDATSRLLGDTFNMVLRTDMRKGVIL
jgi:hypothetical protein